MARRYIEVHDDRPVRANENDPGSCPTEIRVEKAAHHSRAKSDAGTRGTALSLPMDWNSLKLELV